MNLSLEQLENYLVILLVRFEKLELLLQKIKNDISVLQCLILEMKKGLAEVQSGGQTSPTVENLPDSPASATAVEQTPKQAAKRIKRAKRVIEAIDVRSFLHRASMLWENLQRRFHIHIKYTWFCQFICLRYSLKRQRGGIPGSDLSPTTVLSYFKRERAGIM